MMNYLLSMLDEYQQRLYAGLEALRRGRGGERLLALITGLSEEAIVTGQKELQQAALGKQDEPPVDPQVELDRKMALYHDIRGKPVSPIAFVKDQKPEGKRLDLYPCRPEPATPRRNQNSPNPQR
jgi:hypothetical protein